jgi:hypothetical protein
MLLIATHLLEKPSAHIRGQDAYLMGCDNIGGDKQ